MKKHYNASGLVYGELWGGGEGAYPSRKYSSPSKKELLRILKTAVADGSADSGMGYKNLIGGFFTLETVSTIKVKDKEYSREDYEEVFVGKLTEGQRNFLELTSDNME